MNTKTEKLKEIKQPALLYDGDCPLCQNYTQMLSIRENIGELNLINAREHPSLVKESRQLGYMIDDGMLLIIGNEFFYADQALHMLAKLSSSNGFIRKSCQILFGGRRRSIILYPILKFGRKVLLLLLRKTPIHNTNNTRQ